MNPDTKAIYIGTEEVDAARERGEPLVPIPAERVRKALANVQAQGFRPAAAQRERVNGELRRLMGGRR